LVAARDDYNIARRLLLNPLARLLGGKVSDGALRFYNRLEQWVKGDFTTTEAKAKETSSKSAVYGWLAELHESGAVEIVEAPRGRSPARWKLTGKAPNEVVGAWLPEVKEVFPEPVRKHGHNAETFAQM
jgi:hypothetical protein